MFFFNLSKFLGHRYIQSIKKMVNRILDICLEKKQPLALYSVTFFESQINNNLMISISAYFLLRTRILMAENLL